MAAIHNATSLDDLDMDPTLDAHSPAFTRPDRSTGRIGRRWLAAAAALLAGGSVSADSPSILRPLEAVPLAVLPANERGVTALILREGIVYGGTTGRAGHLFSFDPRTKEVRDLHRLAEGLGFSHALAGGKEEIHAGTQADPTGLGRTPPVEGLGRLLAFRIEGGRAAARDLGAPIPGQGIRTMALIEEKAILVGLTWPEGRFFVHRLAEGTSRDLGAIAGHRPHETEEPRQVARALVRGEDGAVYTSGKDGVIHRYDPAADAIAPTSARLPCVPGREGWASLEAAVLAPGGVIYGGTSDGYLFRFDPRSGAVDNLGKPIRQGGFQGLLLAPGGAIVGLAGEPGGIPREARFDPRGGGFTLGGIPRPGGEPCLEGFGALVADGTRVYAGEPDRIARLIIFEVE